MEPLKQVLKRLGLNTRRSPQIAPEDIADRANADHVILHISLPILFIAGRTGDERTVRLAPVQSEGCHRRFWQGGEEGELFQLI